MAATKGRAHATDGMTVVRVVGIAAIVIAITLTASQIVTTSVGAMRATSAAKFYKVRAHIGRLYRCTLAIANSEDNCSFGTL